jgi:hypothetical protein
MALETAERSPLPAEYAIASRLPAEYAIASRHFRRVSALARFFFWNLVSSRK